MEDPSRLVVEASYRTDLGIPEALRNLVLEGGEERSVNKFQMSLKHSSKRGNH